MTIKFNKYNVTDGSAKARIHYSLDNNIHHAKCVTLYAKDYEHELGKMFAEYQNDTDYQTDYFEKGRVTLTPDHPLYPSARARAEANNREWDAKYSRTAA